MNSTIDKSENLARIGLGGETRLKKKLTAFSMPHERLKIMS